MEIGNLILRWHSSLLLFLFYTKTWCYLWCSISSTWRISDCLYLSISARSQDFLFFLSENIYVTFRHVSNGAHLLQNSGQTSSKHSDTICNFPRTNINLGILPLFTFTGPPKKNVTPVTARSNFRGWCPFSQQSLSSGLGTSFWGWL